MDAVSFNGVIIFSSVKVAVKVTSLSFLQQIIALILKTDFLLFFFFFSPVYQNWVAYFCNYTS